MMDSEEFKEKSWIDIIIEEVDKKKFISVQKPIIPSKRVLAHRRRDVMINDKIWNKLIMEAERLDIPMSELIRFIIIQYFERK